MKIVITALEVMAMHGVHPEEKLTPKPFVFDVTLDCDNDAAGISDELGDTVSYSDVCALITHIALSNKFDLIEKLARECAFAIMERFERAAAVIVRVSKPMAPVKAKFGNISAEYALERNDVYLSLGSSTGDRAANLNAALDELSKIRGIRLVRTSSFIDTDPVGGVAHNVFLNCAAHISCLLTPRGLLAAIHGVESKLGRVRTVRWEDRPIDIDIIFFGDKVVCGDGLGIPHPLYRGRQFVIAPLKQLCPEFVCPLTHTAVKDM